ncbi:signal peptidase I [Aeromicrobium sp. PE09-221]|uniref:signal peptidase I n=1 Tax=Aeromicrobium sp. PE09-221 TaxID=1898043 RepID=UPI00112064C8|nr:signal peptidase I [Aeromicrobium sp. PE09-221]
MLFSYERGTAAVRILGIAALIGFFVLAVGAVAALAFSVQVNGTSMHPTLVHGDRLQAQFWNRSSIERFDLVETRTPDEVAIVKRVIGLPGDMLTVESTGLVPVVTVRPEGKTAVYRVENPRWDDQPGGGACCTVDGTEGGTSEFVVPEGEYWLVGDNWGASEDSRVYGFFAADAIKAKLNFRILPLDRFGTVPNPASLVAIP